MAEFVIIYKRKSGESLIEQFSDSTEALKERLRREAAIDDPDIEIAHISAPSLESLKKSHSRYFMGNAEVGGDQVDKS
ncbi:hypothetical protein [Corynebacterium sp. HMSC036D02]|uniref:hypothetical protein n=1 Tax=Corynebacterium sp. HMSC036D02 TaxID=1715013 RepID=UPI00091319C1|nr:hypothetical protein [Corynebacterium sp. HMSC036D02]OHO63834.1 hypothetical protein HMPREF2743_00125 [Corynebacterium sp. HMSC036D02]